MGYQAVLRTTWAAAVLCAMFNLPSVSGQTCGTAVNSPSLTGDTCPSPSTQTPAVAHSWPWVGQLSRTTDPDARCDATLVHAEWALTAKRCVYVFGCQPADFSLTFGEHDTGSATEVLVTRVAQEIVIHENATVDLAMVRLAQPVNTSLPNVGRVCLPDQDDPVPQDAELYVARWTDQSALWQSKQDEVDTALCQELWEGGSVPAADELSNRRGPRGGCHHHGGCYTTTTTHAPGGSESSASEGGTPDSSAGLPGLDNTLGAATLGTTFAIPVGTALLTTLALNPNVGGEETISPFSLDSVMCAGCVDAATAPAPSVDERCTYDHGAALVYYDQNTSFIQVGVLFGSGPFENCEEAPTAYVKVAPYRNWIESVIASNNTLECTALPDPSV